MPETYTGTSLTSTCTRNTQTSTNRTGQTFDIYLGCPILLESFTTDIRTAGTYEFLVNGVVQATVAGVAAATNGVVFTFGTPVELAAGTHTCKLRRSDNASIPWYNYSADPLVATGGTGQHWIGYGTWQEPATSGVHGSLTFKPADGIVRSGIVPDVLSGAGGVSAQTWTVTLDADIELYGSLKILRDADATGYVFSIDAVDLATVTKSGTAMYYFPFIPTSPVAVSAGAHTFKVIGSAARRYFYKSLTGHTPGPDAHVVGWSVWSEAPASTVGQMLFYKVVGEGAIHAGWGLIL